ncbi:NUDIX hydrolase [Candidatus Parcubacteria bacterium]|nr:NUDIX hydrolase [Candidatus Parcubacteria bacterium]
MKQRIRVATIITNRNKVLLVKHVHPESEYTWWVPPGGGIKKEDSSIFDCAKRETFEETNLKIEALKIIYLREYLDKRDSLKNIDGKLNIEIFILADSYDGEVNMNNIKGNGPDELYIKQIEWLSKDEMQDIVVYPEILKNDFWIDYRQKFFNTKYLGRQI